MQKGFVGVDLPKLSRLKTENASLVGKIRSHYKYMKETYGFTKADVDFALKLIEDKENSATPEARKRMKIARWVGHPLGHQADLFETGDTDRRPIDERAFDTGKIAGMEGKGSDENPNSDPNSVPGRAWEKGRQAGVGIQIMQGIKAHDPNEPGSTTLIPANRADAPVVQSKAAEDLAADGLDGETGGAADPDPADDSVDGGAETIKEPGTEPPADDDDAPRTSPKFAAKGDEFLAAQRKKRGDTAH